MAYLISSVSLEEPYLYHLPPQVSKIMALFQDLFTHYAMTSLSTPTRTLPSINSTRTYSVEYRHPHPILGNIDRHHTHPSLNPGKSTPNPNISSQPGTTDPPPNGEYPNGTRHWHNQTRTRCTPIPHRNITISLKQI